MYGTWVLRPIISNYANPRPNSQITPNQQFSKWFKERAKNEVLRKNRSVVEKDIMHELSPFFLMENLEIYFVCSFFLLLVYLKCKYPPLFRCWCCCCYQKEYLFITQEGNLPKWKWKWNWHKKGFHFYSNFHHFSLLFHNADYLIMRRTVTEEL